MTESVYPLYANGLPVSTFITGYGDKDTFPINTNAVSAMLKPCEKNFRMIPYKKNNIMALLMESHNDMEKTE